MKTQLMIVVFGMFIILAGNSSANTTASRNLSGAGIETVSDSGMVKSKKVNHKSHKKHKAPVHHKNGR